MNLGPFILVHDKARELAMRAVLGAPVGMVVTIGEATRNDEQNAKYHALLTEIAKQVTWHGQKFNVLTWKRLTTASWLREMGESPEMIPALDGNGFDVIFEKTSKLGVRKFSALIEWTTTFAAQHGVKFSQ